MDNDTSTQNFLGREEFRVIEDRTGTKFLCPRGHVVSVSVTDRESYSTGWAITVRCSACGASGTAQDSTVCDGPGLL